MSNSEKKESMMPKFGFQLPCNSEALKILVLSATPACDAPDWILGCEIGMKVESFVVDFNELKD